MVEAAMVVIAGMALVAGVFGWWISKFLADKRDSVAHEVEIENLKEDVKALQEDVKRLERLTK